MQPMPVVLQKPAFTLLIAKARSAYQTANVGRRLGKLQSSES